MNIILEGAASHIYEGGLCSGRDGLLKVFIKHYEKIRGYV